MVNPDFVKFAESFHCEGLRCLTKAELPEKMAHFLASENVRTDR
jgi:thiamine pyrophosphate-dependent acetolactate synthase large subunit-like protein